jgi:hypothetical protein
MPSAKQLAGSIRDRFEKKTPAALPLAEVPVEYPYLGTAREAHRRNPQGCGLLLSNYCNEVEE